VPPLSVETLAVLPVLFIALGLFVASFGVQVIPAHSGLRYAKFDSLERLLKVKWVLGFLSFAATAALFGMVVDIFETAPARLFYGSSTVALYIAMFFIASVDKNRADKLVHKLRSASELSPDACLEADRSNLQKAALSDEPVQIVARYDDMLGGSKGAEGEDGGAATVPLARYLTWGAIAFLVFFPLYGFMYVHQNYDRLRGYVLRVVPPQTEIVGPFQLLDYVFLKPIACPESSASGAPAAGTNAPAGQEASGSAGYAGKCLENHTRLQNLRSHPLVMLLLFLYFSLFIFFPLRYVATLFEYRALLRWSGNQGLGLETDVVQKSGFIVSLFVSVGIALVLVNVPFGQLGLFSGLAVAGLSVAFRDTLGNLLAGALLIWDGTLKKGDVITIPRSVSSDTGSTYGIVREMRMRYTIVEDRNTVRRLIPNSVLVSTPVESWTHQDQKVRLSLRIGVGYGTDLRDAKQIMESVCYDVPRILSEKAPQALVVNFGESAIEFSLRFWLRDTSEGIRPVISDVLTNLKERFDEAKIEIPYPHRDLRIRSIDGPGGSEIFDNVESLQGKDGKKAISRADPGVRPATPVSQTGV
jgi:small-conductance mechanosensitive channel